MSAPIFLPLGDGQPLPPTVSRMEMALLGALFRHDEAPAAAEGFRPEYCADPVHVSLGEAIIARWEQAPEARLADADWVSGLGNYLMEVGGLLYLSQIQAIGLPAAEIPAGIAEIRGAWVARKVLDAIDRVADLTMQAGEECFSNSGYADQPRKAAEFAAKLGALAAEVAAVASTEGGQG